MANWFVINTKPKKEFQVAKLFAEGGFTYYNPLYKSEKQVRPFFPGYGFLIFDFPSQYQMVKYTRGVKRVVGNRDFDYAKSWILSILSPLWQSGEESGNCSWEIKKC